MNTLKQIALGIIGFAAACGGVWLFFKYVVGFMIEKL